ncbi:hypothetical protein TrVFT333_006771 [Trichoderma virens FT-333]|nr:hypothetical protein TrVFT333_006771 [Trichoderma virens FT-333]
MTTEAQEEFDRLVANNTHRETLHPEDRDDADSHHGSDLSEEEQYRNARIEEAMRMPTAAAELKLPRSESEEAIFSGGDDDEEELFLSQWREARRQELEKEAGQSIRTRRTSPSMRIYGRMDEVDALGYLDAIEKVNRETTVVVFVYDHESEVSSAIESVLLPLVKSNPSVHFVKVHYEDIEFDNAAVPALLAYRNQGDLFANLTGIIEMMPDDEHFGAESLEKVLKKHGVL